MATYPTVLPGTSLLLLLGDGGSPEVFGEPCGLTTKTWELSASTNTNVIAPCDDPEAAAWESTDVNALSASGSGSGMLSVEAFTKWNTWFMSTLGRNMQIKLDHPDLGYYEGFFKITSFKMTGTRGSKVLVDVAFKNDGPVEYVE